MPQTQCTNSFFTFQFYREQVKKKKKKLRYFAIKSNALIEVNDQERLTERGVIIDLSILADKLDS